MGRHDEDEIARQFLECVGAMYDCDVAAVIMVESDGTPCVLKFTDIPEGALRAVLSAFASGGWNTSKSL